MTGSQDPLRKSAATQTDQQLPTSFAGHGCDARGRLDAHDHLNARCEVAGMSPGPDNVKHEQRGLIPHPAASDLTESVKPRELSAAEREAQIVALWQIGRASCRERVLDHV